MFFTVQVVLALCGMVILLLGKVPLGRRDIDRPFSSLIGGLLVAPVLLCGGLSLFLQVASVPSSMRSAVRGQQPPQAGLPEWVDPVVTFGALALVLGLGILAYRTEEEINPAPLPDGRMANESTDFSGPASADNPAPPIPPVAPSCHLPPEAAGQFFAPDQAKPRINWSRGTPAWPELNRPLLENTPVRFEKTPVKKEEPLDPARGIQRCHARPGTLPPAVEALGREQRVHAPWVVLTLLRRQPAIALGIGLAFLGAAAALLAARMTGVGLVLGIVGGIITVLPWVDLEVPSFVVFREALVLVNENEYTVIPWGLIESISPGRQGRGILGAGAAPMLKTADGWRVELSSLIQGVDKLIETIKERMKDERVPALLQTINDGGSAYFGRFRVSLEGLSFRGRTLLWDEIASITIVVVNGTRSLVIREKNAAWANWCDVELATVPNDLLLLELVRNLCPSSLLVPLSLTR